MTISLAGLYLCPKVAHAERGTGLDVGLKTLVGLGVKQESVRGVYVAMTSYSVVVESTMVINRPSSAGMSSS